MESSAGETNRVEVVGKDDALEITQAQAGDGFHALNGLVRHVLLNHAVLIQVRQFPVQRLVLGGHHLYARER